MLFQKRAWGSNPPTGVGSPSLALRQKKVQSAHYLAHTPHDAKLSLERALLKKNVCVRCIFSVYCKPVGKEL